jgi:hypothetical protein
MRKPALETDPRRAEKQAYMKAYNAAYIARKKAEDPDWRREENRASWRRYTARNKERLKPIRRARDTARRPWMSFLHRLRRYGLTLDQFHARAESQDFSCAICGQCVELEIDHCHSAGHVRGLLCCLCNDGLGKFKDDPTRLEAAIAYLARRSELVRRDDVPRGHGIADNPDTRRLRGRPRGNRISSIDTV